MPIPALSATALTAERKCASFPSPANYPGQGQGQQRTSKNDKKGKHKEKKTIQNTEKQLYCIDPTLSVIVVSTSGLKILSNPPVHHSITLSHEQCPLSLAQHQLHPLTQGAGQLPAHRSTPLAHQENLSFVVLRPTGMAIFVRTCLWITLIIFLPVS
jgi:hypothetical protein